MAEGLLEPEWLYEAHNSRFLRRPELPKLAETKKSALKGKTRVEIAKMSKEKLASKHAKAQARLRAARVKAAEKGNRSGATTNIPSQRKHPV